MMFKVPSHPNCSMIPRFCDSVVLWFYDCVTRKRSTSSTCRYDLTVSSCPFKVYSFSLGSSEECQCLVSFQLLSPTSLQVCCWVTVCSHLHFRAYGRCCAALKSLMQRGGKKNHIKAVISFSKELYYGFMRCALKSLHICFPIFCLLWISPVLIHNEFCCFMEMTHARLHQDGGVYLDYLWEGGNERWQSYYKGEQLWGRAMFQLSTPGMPKADSDHIMQLKSKAQDVSGLVCEAFRRVSFTSHLL